METYKGWEVMLNPAPLRNFGGTGELLPWLATKEASDYGGMSGLMEMYSYTLAEIKSRIDDIPPPGA